MKLFKSLLVAPAALGLLAPMSATANELNLTEVSDYSSPLEVESINDFNPAKEIAITNSRVDGLEARFNDYEAGSFSETTSASFGSTFYVGTIEEGTDNGKTTFSYDFALDLNTSFTGDDSLDVAIIGGNAGDGNEALDAAMGGDGTADVLTLDGIAYTFPIGGFTITAGDGVGVDDLNTGACAYSAFHDTVSDCGTSSVGGQADSAIAASYDFGNGFTIAGGIGGGGTNAATVTTTVATTTTVVATPTNVAALVDGSGAAVGNTNLINTTTSTSTVTETVTAASNDGLFSDEDASTIGLELAYAADTYGVSFAYTNDDNGATVPAENTYYSIQAAFTPDAPYSISAGYEFDEDDNSSYFAGVTSEFGAGSVSFGVSTQALASDHEDNMIYEVSYAYDVNDGMTITPGAFIVENATAGADDAIGLVVTTSFSF